MKRALCSKGQCGKNRALKEKWPKLREQEARMWFEPGRSEHAGVLDSQSRQDEESFRSKDNLCRGKKCVQAALRGSSRVK